MNRREAKRLATQYASEVLLYALDAGPHLQVLEVNGCSDGDLAAFEEAWAELVVELSNRYGGRTHGGVAPTQREA